MVYMHLMLFCICLNFGLGLAHIPDTPLTIPDAVDTVGAECTNSLQTQGLLTRVDTGGVITYVPSVDANGNPLLYDFEGQSSNMTDPIYDPLIDQIEYVYSGVETIKNVMLGGYVVNVIDSITLTCDTNPESATYGQGIDSEVMIYVKAGLHIIFGFMVFLTVLYIITGKTFGL